MKRIALLFIGLIVGLNIQSQVPDTAILHISVDMNYYISQGIFDPEVDYVDLPNSVETWDELALPPMEDPDSNGIYEYSLEGLAIGDSVEFKARMNGSWSEPHDFPSGDNRAHIIETPSDSLYFWFNDEMPIADWSEFQTGAEHVIDVEITYPEKSDTTSTQAYLLFWYGNWDINADGYVAFPHRPDGKVPFNVPAFGDTMWVPAYIPVDGNPDVTFLASWDPDPTFIGENMRAFSQDTVFPLIEEGYDDMFGTPLVIENIDTSYVPPQTGFSDIWYTNEQMTIDGDTSEATWDAIPRNFINKLQMGTVDDSLDLSGFWKATWDTENLYVLVDVTDQTKFNYGEGSGTSWENDNVELYFDLHNDKTGGVADDIDNILYRFSWNLTEQESFNAIWDGVEFGQLDKSDGYIFEIKIPWDALRHEVFFELTNGLVLGFDVALSDNEGSGRETVMNWSNPNSDWLDLSGVGDIQLSGRPPADVEFNVDMRVPLIDSTLDPAIDFVDVAGSFNEWGNFIDTLYDLDGDSIYSTTLYGLHAGNTIEYKFRINGSWDDAYHERTNGPNRAHLLHDGLNALNHIYDDKLPYDITARRILSPKTMAGLGVSEAVELELENTGALPLDGIDVYYQINGGSIVTETITDTLYPSEPFIYSFAQSADLSSQGKYNIKAWIDHPDDEDVWNDTLYQDILHLPIISSYPYSEDFETDEGFWSAQPLQGPLTWEWGMPDSGTGLAVDAAASGSNCWVTNLAGAHGDFEKSCVMSPVFDLSNMTLPYVSFNKKSAVDYGEGASNLQVSIDTGQTWYTVGRFEQDTNWYDIENFGPLSAFGNYRDGWSGYDSNWTYVAHHIKAMAGKPYVMFRITFATDNLAVSEGFAFDDFMVYEGAPQYNIGITNVQIDEGSECYPGNSENVHVDITNQGLEPVADYDVTLFVDDQELAIEFISDTLNPFDTLHYTFSAKVDLYTTEFKRNFKLEVFAGLPSDGFMPDDNYIRNIEVFGDYMVQPGYAFYNTCNSGLNENNVWSMLQGDNGDIWFTGFRGISRFDGTNWTHYTTENGLAYDYSWASIKVGNGDLWFLAAGVPQATVYDGTNFSIIDLPGVYDECAYEDDAGNLWFGSYNGAGVLKYDGSSFIQYGHDQLGRGSVVLSIAQNVNGNILVATDHGMVEFDGSKWNEMFLHGNPINASEIFTGDGGNLWMAANNNFYHYDGEAWHETAQINNIENLYAEDIQQDSLGNVWFAGGFHVYKNNGATWQVYSKETGLIPDHYFYSLLMDSDTTVWAGSYRGGAVNFDPVMLDTILDDPSLTAFFPFDGDAVEATGTGIAGTLFGPTLATDRFGMDEKAFYYNGFGDYTLIGNDLQLINDSSHFTISAWIKPNLLTEGQNTILGEREPNGHNYQFAVIDHSIYFSLWDKGNEHMFTGNPGTIMENEWQMVTVTSDGSNLRLYWNDMLDSEFPGTYVPDSHPSELYLGTWDGFSDMFDGEIDDVRFYNRALTQEEITQLVYEGGFEPVWPEIPESADAIFTEDTIVIDGFSDELVWDTIPANMISKVEAGAVMDSLDLSGYWKALWNNEHLVILVDIYDEAKHNLGAGYESPWENDNVELFFDLFNNKYGAVPDEFDNKQYRFIWDLNELTGHNVNWDGVEFAQTNRADGYTFEIRLPWYSLNEVDVPVMNGTTLGFDVSVNDNDDGTSREATMNWSNPNSNWEDLTMIGDLNLTGMPPAEVTFEVNMSYQAQTGSFDPGSDFVDLAGTFTNWGSDPIMLEDPDGDSIYSATIELSRGSYIEYKYRINGEWNTAEFPGGENRMYTIMDSNTVIYDWYNDEFPYDVGLISLISPDAGCGLTSSEVISVEIENNGNEPIAGFEITYQIDSNASVTEVFTDTLAPYTNTIYDFSQPADISTLGFHEIYLEVYHPEDAHPDNNHLYHELYNTESVLVTDAQPYFEDFEGDQSWSSYGQNNSWMLGTPNHGAINGSYSWSTNLTGYYNDEEYSFVESPCFNLSSIVVPVIDFNMDYILEECCDGVELQYSGDGGNSWHPLHFEGNTDVKQGYRNEYGWSGNSYGVINIRKPVTFLGGESSVKFRFKLQSDNSVNQQGFTFDDFQIYEGALDDDISLTGILNPVPGCGLSSSEEVVVGLVNKGKNPATDITLAFSRDSFNTVTASEFISDTLYPGEMIDYTFSNRVDLSIFREYDFGVHVDYEGDLNPADNLIMMPISNKPSYAIDSLNPYSEGFEGINFWTTGGHRPSWEQGIPGGLVINQPAEGSYVMATNLSGKYNTDEDSYIESQCFDFTNAVSPQIRFSLWTRTEECCDHLSLWYTTNNGEDWYKTGDNSDPFWYNNFEGFSGNTGGWATKLHSLDFLSGEPNVRFRFVFNSDGGVEKEGAAIDDLYIYDKPAYDVSLTALYLPKQSCDYPDNQLIEVGVSSLGRNAATGFDVGYQVDNNTPVIETVSETVFRDVEYNHLFGTNADLSADGMHTIKVWTDHPSDGIRDNDTLVYQVLNKPTINTYPYVESFEDGPGYWTSSKFEGLYTSWELGVPNGNQIKNASDGNRAWVTNLDGPYADNEVAYVESPCFDLSSLASPVLSVDIFSDNNYYDDGAIVQYSPDDGMNWYYLDHAGAIDNWYDDFSDAIYYNSDGSDAWTGNAPWRTAVRGISELAGDSLVKFRILFASYENHNSDEGFAFDNFRVYEKSASDAGVTEIYEPLTNCGLDTGYVTVDIKNFGDNLIDSIPISYQLNNNPPVTEYYLGLVNPGDFFEFSFGSVMDISTVGTYHLKVWTSLENDSVQLNDTLRHMFENQDVYLVEPATPFVEDFENGQGGWHVEGDNPSWQYGQPANDYISEASSGSNAWVSALNMDYNDNEFSYLYSPCFDLSLMNAPVIELHTIYEMESCCDGVMLEYSVDGGYSWQSLGTENEMGLSTRNWFVNYLGWTGNSGGWQNSMRISPELANEPIVKFRLKLESDGGYTEEGFGFDDFKIYTLPEYDLRLHSVLSPQSGSMLTNNEFFEVRIANEGEKDIQSFSVGYQLETSSPRIQQFNVSIPSQSTKSVFLDQIPVDLSVIGDYRFNVWVNTPDDSLRYNDTIKDYMVYRKPVIQDYPYSEDFENGKAFWHTYGKNASWEHGMPSGQVINTASSGDNAWVTNLSGEYNKGEVAFVEGPAFDLSDLVLPVIELKIFRDLPDFVEGAAIQYSVDNGEWEYLGRKGEGMNWYNNDIISVYSMEEPADGWTGNHPRWVLARHSLETLSGEHHVKFRMVFTSMEMDYYEFSGFEGFAFDDISIYESAKPYDLAPVAVHHPNPRNNCGLTSAEPVMMSVKNKGLNAASGFDVSYRIGGGSPVTESIAQELQPGEVLDYEFTGLADFSLSGYYELMVYTSYGNDQRRFNDTIFEHFLNKPLIVFPDTGIYSEDFESGENGWIAGGENSSWQLGTPNTPNISNAYSGMNAWVTNPNGPYNDNEHSYIESPCFDLTGLISPAIEFGMIYYIEECCDGVKLAYSVNGGQWQMVNNMEEFDGGGEFIGDGELNGDGELYEENYGWYDNENGWTGTYEPYWRHEYAVLPELGGQSNVKFRFIFNSDGSVREDGFAMDDFTILESAYENDVAPVALISPSKMNNCDLGSEPLVVDIFNKGLNEVSGFDITFVINYSDTITETVAGPIAPGATLEYTTTADYDFSSYTYYDVAVFTSLPSDENTMNDYYYEYFNNSPVINTFPYAEDFEEGEGYWTAQGGIESSWEYGTPQGEVIYEDTNFAWVTGIYGLYPPYSNFMLVSPCLDLSSIQNPAISFDMWTDIPDASDGLTLQYSVDNGMSWHTLGSLRDDDWYNESFTDNQGNRQDYFSGMTGGWKTVHHSLIEIPDLSNVRLRFNFGSDGQFEGEGVALDKINIFEETVYPVSFAVTDQEVYQDETVYLDGSLSEDAYGGDNFSFAWESLDGIALMDDTTLQPYFKPADANVSYGFVLTVTDNVNGTISRDTVSVSVLPTPGPVHFTDIIWSGEPNNPMEFEILKAIAFGASLEPNDEIALFDGENMVAASLIKRRFILGPLFMTASMDDAGTGELEGFIEGNSITAKVWDASEGKEYDAVIILYKPGSNTVYTDNGYAKAELLVDQAKQSIALAEGWNIMSINLHPYTRLMDSLFAPLRINESLVKVQDESGYSYEYIMGQWLNGIDLHKSTEGYKVRVDNDTELEVTGKPVDLPVNINLRKGWNIMGYPVSTPQSAELILSYLINNDILVKVQDETGASIESVSPIGWVNHIGNLQPGKGYKIKVQIPSQISIDSAFYKSTRIIRKNDLTPVRFSTVWTGNGLDHMNVYVNELLVDGQEAVTGTEVAVFDGERCVGAGVYNRTFDYLTFTASKDDPFTEDLDGYRTGNNLAFKVYDPNTGEWIDDAVVTYVNEDASTTFEPSATTVVNIRASTGSTGVSGISGLTAFLGENYPNPFAEETFINYTIAREGNVRIEIIDLLGKRVKTLADRRMVPGHYTIKWNRMDEEGERVTEGIYLYRLRTDDRSYVRRMIVME